MSEMDKQAGDGADDCGQAASGLAKMGSLNVGKDAGGLNGVSTAAKTATAAKGGRAAAWAASVPWGAVLQAAWALCHTLMKILVCCCLAVLILAVMVISLPSVVSNSIFGLDGTRPEEGATLLSAYGEMAKAVSDVVGKGYDASLKEAERIITEGGYDYDLSMEAMVNHVQGSAGYDVCYILAAYSASMGQRNVKKDDMVKKLEKVSGSMFKVTYQEKEKEVLVPVTYYTYEPVTVKTVTGRIPAGISAGQILYRYRVEDKTYYVRDEAKSSDTGITVDAYVETEVTVPEYTDGRITGTTTERYYKAAGREELNPGTEVVRYVECTIHPFDSDVVVEAFGIDLDAEYDQFHITYKEAIRHMADALKMTLYGSLGEGQNVPFDDRGLLDFVEGQGTSPAREQVLMAALSLVGKVPYFWGGKSAPGWNQDWNTPKLVTAAGSGSTGTIRPYGLDCSGFTQWVYNTALGMEIGAGTSGQYANTRGISASQLKPGDLGFWAEPDGSGWNHVLIFAGYGSGGGRMWVHCTAGSGVVLDTPGYEGSLVLRRLTGVDYDAPAAGSGYGEAMYEIPVIVTHYCPCEKCCGPGAKGITASGKQVKPGMVAMAAYYPFGTQIMINGTMYTVEDRGSALEGNIHRVDIYVPDHAQALRMGRYMTTAKIYRLGR